MRVILKPAGLAVISLALAVLAGVVLVQQGRVRDADNARRTAQAALKGRETPVGPAASGQQGQMWKTADVTPHTWRYTVEQPGKDWADLDFNDSGWQTGQAGFGNDQTASIHTEWKSADIWLRTEVTLPKEGPLPATFRVFHDEDAEIYVNGVLAAPAPGYSSGYAPLQMSEAGHAALKAGERNIIAVHCHNGVGGQFIDVGF